MSLLDSVLTHLPIGSHEWECVAAEHNEIFQDKDQTVTSIWRKFSQLLKAKKPIGDPTCPPNVDNDEPKETSTDKATTSKESNGANSAAAAMNYDGFTAAGTRFPPPMVSPRIRDRHVSNNIDSSRWLERVILRR